MQKTQKIKAASGRVKSVRNPKPTKPSGYKRVWNVICWPFRMIWRNLKWVWNWICNIDLIGLINTTLLIAIIVMFSMLINNIVQGKQTRVVVMSTPAESTTKRVVKPRQHIQTTLPINKDIHGRLTSRNINIVPTNAKPTTKVAMQNNIMYGDVILESRNDAALLRNGATIQGNLYLQHMRKYVLPCDIRINGNLFLRDLGLLEFCGDFTITGNIYVTPDSSFAPVPGTARIGGYVVL